MTGRTEGVPDIFAEFPLRSSKVAIVGFATESMGDAPWDDPDCEVWILNMLHAHVLRWDRLWELHDRACVEAESAEKEQDRLAARGGLRHLDALRAEAARPVYTVEPWPDVPMSRRFPVELYAAHFDPAGPAPLSGTCAKVAGGYYTSTFAFMLAAAVRGIVGRRVSRLIPNPAGELICVAGVEMLNGSEYEYERSCAEFWIGVALGHGIPVDIPARSALLESDGLYGYAHANQTLELLTRTRGYYQHRKDEFRKQADGAQARFNQARSDWNTWDGVRQALELALADPDLTAAQAARFAGRLRQAQDNLRTHDTARDAAHVERHVALGAAQGVDWCIGHVTYLSRGGKV